jgi:tetratricopeptide (TPR) repeat protein
MPADPNKISQFWQELKRRKVIKVTAMYAATAFIIMEAADIILPRLGLPDWTVTFLIILLIVGFPITVILSWIFDVTPAGIRKTESADATLKKEPPPAKSGRKLKVSDGVIVVLLVIVFILAYPKIFSGGADLNAMTNTATVLNEYGKVEKRQVFKEEYVHKLMILPFEAEDPDSVNAWLQYGILEGVWEDLLQFQYVLAYHNAEATHLQEQITAARINNCPYFLTGNYRVADGMYTIASRLHLTKNGAVEKERTYRGRDLFALFDSISLQTRMDLGVPTNIIKAFPDLPFREHTTGNPDAFRYYIFGRYPGKRLSTISINVNYYKALEEDSTFALAAYAFAWQLHFYLVCKIGAKNNIGLAMRHRERLPEYRDIQTRVLHYSILGEKEKAITLSEMQYDLQPYNIELLLTLIDVYNTNFLNTEAEKAIIRLNELVPDYPDYQIMLAKNYLLSDKVNEGLKFIEKRIQENPENTAFLLKKGQFYLHRDDLDHAEVTFQKAMLLSPDKEKMCLLFLDHIKFAREKNLKPADLDEFTGRCRAENAEYYFDMIIHNDRLFRKEANQWGYYYYPVSDTSFIGTWEDISNTSMYYRNSQGKAFKLFDKYTNIETPQILWMQDSLILKAEKLLESNRLEEALMAFQQANSENPEHYYLSYYIRYLEFILGMEDEKIEPFLESFTGDYLRPSGYIVTNFKEGNRLFGRTMSGNAYELLPMSEVQFMIPSFYFNTLEFVKVDNKIVGVDDIVLKRDVVYMEKITEQALSSQNK